MSPKALRWSAVPLGLFAAGLRVAAAWWVEPPLSDLGVWWDWLVMTVAILVGIGVPIGIFSLLSRGPKPSGLTRAQGRLIAPPSPANQGVQTILLMFLGAGLVENDKWLISTIALGIFWSCALAFVVVQRPRVELDPEGLTIQRLWRRTRLGWDELTPGGPFLESGRNPRRLWVTQRVDIPVGPLHVDPAFLTATIHHYLEHPENRQRVGTDHTDVLYAPR